MSDIKPLPQTPILASDVDKTTRNAFTDVHTRVNQLIKWLGTVSQTVLPHKDTHKTGGSDPLTPADIGAATTTHASTHKTGGSDALTPADIGAAAAIHAATHKTGGSDPLTATDIGAAPTNHSHTLLSSIGPKNANDPPSTWPYGLSFSPVYNNGYPVPYGNLITIKLAGTTQILIAWPGSDGGPSGAWVRGARDVGADIWGPWSQL